MIANLRHLPGPRVRGGLTLLIAWLFSPPLAAAPVVEFIQPEPSSVAEHLNLTGSVTTPLDASLSPQVAGLVARVTVDAGDRVEAGQALVELDATLAEMALQRLDATVREGRTQLAEARRLRDEGAPLAADGSLAQSAFKTRQAEAEQAAAALARLEAERAEQAERVARHVIRAPFDGVIRRRLTAPGEWVAGGDSVLELVATENLRVDVQVPQRRYAAVTPDTGVRVHIDGLPGREFGGRIAARVPALDSQARSFLVRVALDDPAGEVAPGMSARVRFDLPGEREALVIPRDALLRFPDGSAMVWVVDADGAAERRPVELGPLRGERAVVLGGLTAEARVIVRGNEALKPGEAVTARPHTPR